MNFPASLRVFVCTLPTDMRKQMTGLAIVVRETMRRNPRSGELFVFRNRRGDMVRVLFFDQQGYCLLSKRMERGTFKIALPDNSGGCLEITGVQLSQVLTGSRVVVEKSKAAA